MNTETHNCLEVEVLYLERIALIGENLVTVSLNDVSLQDVPALTMASQTLRTDKNVPFAFTLRYDPSLIKDNHTYSLSARIEHEGRLLYINTSAYEVDLNNPSDTPLTVVVQRVANG
ncbi:YbaY family lipoprotein [Pseudomonas sp. UM16]|uniref:YbaY family lipoprotein n=1 Tax=Pseudomonas sp. UM16 TaxID=3158962 RepID=UPI00398FF7DC